MCKKTYNSEKYYIGIHYRDTRTKKTIDNESFKLTSVFMPNTRDKAAAIISMISVKSCQASHRKTYRI